MWERIGGHTVRQYDPTASAPQDLQRKLGADFGPGSIRIKLNRRILQPSHADAISIFHSPVFHRPEGLRAG